MPKAGGFFTPKAIGNRIKAKGLQKLKWYCQMCQKQCRDENGFKCHTQSEGHLRQMAIFKSSSGRIMNEFSRTFERDFMNILSKRHNTKWVKVNSVYQELIQDRHHVHMNATYWGSLTSFVTYLGHTGKCNIEEQEKGWYVQYIDNSNPEYMKKQRLLEKRKLHAVSEEALHEKEMKLKMKSTLQREKEIERERQANGETPSALNVNGEVKITEVGELKLGLTLKKGKGKKKKKLISRKKPVSTERIKREDVTFSGSLKRKAGARSDHPVSAAERIRRDIEDRKHRAKLFKNDGQPQQGRWDAR